MVAEVQVTFVRLHGARRAAGQSHQGGRLAFVAKRVDSRVKIIRAAAREFQKRGYEATTIDDIARRAGVTKPGVYYHFDSKRELLYAVVSRAMDFVEEAINEVTAIGGDSETMLRQLIYRNALMIAKERDGAFTLLVIDLPKGLSPKHRRSITHRKRVYFNTIRTLLNELKEQGTLRDVDITVSAFSMLGMVIWISKWFSARGRLSQEEVAGQVTELALSAVLNDRPLTMAELELEVQV